MFTPLSKMNSLQVGLLSSLKLPTPSNLSFMWNFGSLLGMALLIQLSTGIFLSMGYSSDTSVAFDSVVRISKEVNYGWLLRTYHANGASMYFFFMYMHMARGVYYGAYNFNKTWFMGVTIFLMSMATAFLGYVLPWGQMSFWGASVITGLFSAVPMAGEDLVLWLWGGFSVDSPTLTRFYSLHFLLPFLISAVVMVHLIFLHDSGSNNPLGLPLNYDKIYFHPFFTFKDLVGFLFSFGVLSYLVFFHPWALSDPENFIKANPLVTPVHIQPEWYFLFAYAILRSVPNKLGGVVALALSVLVYYGLPFQKKKMNFLD